MLHPSYSDLMKVVNSEAEQGEQPLVQSRYSIVMATAKRARQIITQNNETEIRTKKKPLSEAVEELSSGRVRIVGENEPYEELIELKNETLKAREEKRKQALERRQAQEQAEKEAADAARAAEKTASRADKEQESFPGEIFYSTETDQDEYYDEEGEAGFTDSPEDESEEDFEEYVKMEELDDEDDEDLFYETAEDGPEYDNGEE